MESQITYGTDGWRIIIKNLWNKAKVLNMDFRGVSDKEEFVERVFGKEKSKEMPIPAGDIVPNITTAYILAQNSDKVWELYDSRTSCIGLIFLIEETMKTQTEIVILIGGEFYQDGKINTKGQVLEKITVVRSENVEKLYTDTLDTVISANSFNELGYFVSNDEAEKIIMDFNIELRCGEGDKPDEESALFIYEDEVVRIRQRSNGGWIVYHIKVDLNQL